MRRQGGFTMIELLVAMTLSILVLGVTVTAFVSLLDEDRTVTEHNEAQTQARTAMQRMARQLRNLASPTALRNVKENRPRAVEVATPWDLVARVVDDNVIPVGSQNSANLMRVRWCLNGADPRNGVLWMQTQRWTTALPPAVPGTGTCPASGWSSQQVAAQHIVNLINPATPRPMLTYDSSDPEKISRVHTDLFIDPTPGRSPVEAQLGSGVLLRNQNQFPVAAFEIVQIGVSGSNQVLRFDGSASVDPESQPLKYCWFVDPPTPTPDCAATPAPASFKGEGVVISYSMPPGSHRVVLVVEDPAGLRDEEERTWP